MDQDPWLLNCPNGTLDLRTGTLRDHDRRDHITKITDADFQPDATCPRWDAFLEQVLPDPEVRAFLRRAAGYSLTGQTSEQVLFFMVGGGANGKTTFLRALQDTLGGDFAIQAPSDLLLATTNRSHPTEIAGLRGVRVAVCTEVGFDRAFDEVRVKQLTGGDILVARRMREDFTEFEPTHKLWIAANHRPSVRGTDEAIWRRILVVPFDEFIPEPDRDRGLPEALRVERAGILAWMVRGCMEWQENGLQPPALVREAGHTYRTDMDAVARFIDERVGLERGARTAASDMFAAYQQWSEDVGEAPVSQKRFGTSLTERGFKKQKGGTVVYLNTRLMPANDEGPGPSGPSGPSSDINALGALRKESMSEVGPDRPDGPALSFSRHRGTYDE
jgi:putative DNA primase/helicase